jgi:hypothetical protein
MKKVVRSASIKTSYEKIGTHCVHKTFYEKIGTSASIKHVMKK